MAMIDVLKHIAQGAGVGVAVVTALPVFGAVGTATGVGVAVGATVGALCGLADSLNQDK